MTRNKVGRALIAAGKDVACAQDQQTYAHACEHETKCREGDSPSCPKNGGRERKTGQEHHGDAAEQSLITVVARRPPYLGGTFMDDLVRLLGRNAFLDQLRFQVRISGALLQGNLGGRYKILDSLV